MPLQGIGNPSYTFLERVAISNDQTAVRRLYKDIKTFRTLPKGDELPIGVEFNRRQWVCKDPGTR